MKSIVSLFVLFFILCFFLTSCNGNATSTTILEEQGYTNVEITGYNPFACSEDDMYRLNFTATSPNGTPVKGVVCSAPLKGYTIRFFPN
jgi:hypothetical protein